MLHVNMHVSVEVRGSIQTLFNSSIENNSCVQVLVPQRVAFKSNKGSSAKTPNKRTEFCDYFAVDGVLYMSETVLCIKRMPKFRWEVVLLN